MQGCSNHADKIEQDVIAFQATIDSLISEVIVPIKTDLDNQIIEKSITQQDTFQLARKRIPITKIQFLVSNEYFVLDSTLTKFRKHRITTEELAEQLKNSQFRVDSLVTYELKYVLD